MSPFSCTRSASSSSRERARIRLTFDLATEIDQLLRSSRIQHAIAEIADLCVEVTIRQWPLHAPGGMRHELFDATAVLEGDHRACLRFADRWIHRRGDAVAQRDDVRARNP